MGLESLGDLEVHCRIYRSRVQTIYASYVLLLLKRFADASFLGGLHARRAIALIRQN